MLVLMSPTVLLMKVSSCPQFGALFFLGLAMLPPVAIALRLTRLSGSSVLLRFFGVLLMVNDILIIGFV